MSLLSDNGTRLEEIAQLVGHSGTAVTEAVYRKQIRPVLQQSAVIMDRIFGSAMKGSHAVSHSGMRKGHLHRWKVARDLGRGGGI